MKFWRLIVYLFSFIIFPEVVFWGLLALVSIDLSLLIPNIVKNLFGDQISNGKNYMMYSLVFMMITATVSSYVLKRLTSAISQRITIRMSIGAQTAAMMRVMSLPTSFFKDYSAGDIALRLNLLKPFCNILFITFSDIVYVLFYTLLNIVQGSWYGSLFASFTTAFSTVIGLCYFNALNRQTKQSIKSLEKETEASGVTYEMITGIQKIKLTGSEKRFFSRWSKVYAEAARVKYSPPVIITVIKVMPVMISFAAALLLYVLTNTFRTSASMYYAVSIWIGLYLGSIIDLFDSLPMTATLGPIIKLLEPLFDCEPENDFGNAHESS